MRVCCLRSGWRASIPAKRCASGSSAGTTRAHHRLRSAFIVTQVALALVLLFTSGLLLRSIPRTSGTQTSIRSRSHRLCRDRSFPRSLRRPRSDQGTTYQPLLDRLQHAPGIAAAGLINITPIQSWGSNSDVHIKGQPPYPPNQEMLAEERMVTPGYYSVFGIRLVRGRLLSPGNGYDSRHPEDRRQ